MGQEPTQRKFEFTPSELKRLLFIWDNATKAGLVKFQDIITLINTGHQEELDHHMETLDVLYWGINDEPDA
jgi:hypothetical protein